MVIKITFSNIADFISLWLFLAYGIEKTGTLFPCVWYMLCLMRYIFNSPPSFRVQDFVHITIEEGKIRIMVFEILYLSNIVNRTTEKSKMVHLINRFSLLFIFPSSATAKSIRSRLSATAHLHLD